MKKENVFMSGGIVVAIASSLCCVLPLIAVIFGLGAFGVASAFETPRPYLLILAFAALGYVRWSSISGHDPLAPFG